MLSKTAFYPLLWQQNNNAVALYETFCADEIIENMIAYGL